MPDFSFDETRSFEDNIELYLTYMESEDAELGSLLRGNFAYLKGNMDDSARRNARSDFSKNVLTELITKEDV